MKNSVLRLLVVPSLLLAVSSAMADSYDQNVNTPGPGVFYGSGNANGFWTVDTSGGVELGLRAHERFPVPLNVFNSSGNGYYSFADGPAISPVNRGSWNYDFSINTAASGLGLGSYRFILSLDFDPSAGTSWSVFNPLIIPDNALSGISYAQNSENPGFPVVGLPGYDKTIPGTYDVVLTALTLGGDLVTETHIRINVNGGTTSAPISGAPLTVPDSASTMLLLGSVLPGLAMLRRKIARA